MGKFVERVLISMKLLSLVLSLVFAAKNEECPANSEGAAERCESACQDSYIECVIECGEDITCISDCTRADFECLAPCPCHDNCFDGCPCENGSEFCIPCREEFAQDYFKCEDAASFRFLDCSVSCHILDHACYDRCQDKLIDEVKGCPCMERCPLGCPCPEYPC